MIDFRSIQGILGGLRAFDVTQIVMTKEGLTAHLVDRNGNEFTLRLDPVAQLAEEAPEPAPEPTPLRPTTMAPVGRSSEAVKRIAQSPKLPPEAKTLVAELARTDLRPGDDVRLIAAAQVASASGDLAPLKALVRQYSPPPKELHS